MTTSEPTPDPEEPSPDAERLAALDDRLAGHANPGAEFTADDESRIDPVEIDLLLLLNQAGAEFREQREAAEESVGLPDRLGRFAILRQVGSGGFANVHEAIDRRLRRRVALKVARPECLVSSGLRRRFVREAELAARLSHPNIVPVFEVGESDGYVYIVEDFCDGGSLADWLDRHPGPMPARMAARVARAVADAAAEAHAQGISHRDIKPGNVLLASTRGDAILPPERSQDQGFTVKLGDFGLGKLSAECGEESPLTALTRAGSRIGTPAWMAPEQIDHSIGTPGPATDVHGIGLLLDRLLTGTTRHAGQSDAETMRLVLLAEPEWVGQPGAVPADLAAVCLKCLAKRPEDRYPSACFLRDDLDRFLVGAATLARPLSPFQRARRIVGRRPATWGIAAAVAAAVVVAATAWRIVTIQRAEVAQRAAEVRHRDAAAELRRGFELLRSGSGEATLAGLAAAREADAALADSFVGRWLEARAHAEERILFDMNRATPPPMPGEPVDLYCIRLAPDGRRLAVGAANGTLWFVDLDAQGQPAGDPRPIAAHDEINGMDFSPDGGQLATVGQDGLVRLWDVATGRLVREVARDTGPLFGVGFSPDGTRLAWGGESRTLFIEPLDDGDERGLVKVTPFVTSTAPDQPDIASLCFLDDDSLVAVSGKQALQIRASDGAIEQAYVGHGWGIGIVAVSPDRSSLITAGTDRRPRLWDVATGGIVAELPLHPDRVQGVAWLADGSGVATGCRDGVIRVFGRDGGQRNRLVGHRGRTWDLHPGSRGRILSAGGDGTVRQWDPTATLDVAGCRRLSPSGSGLLAIGDSSTPGSILVVGVTEPGAEARVVSCELDLESGHERSLASTAMPIPVGAAFEPTSGRIVARGIQQPGGSIAVFDRHGERRLPQPAGLDQLVPSMAAFLPVGGVVAGYQYQDQTPWLVAWGSEVGAARLIADTAASIDCVSVSLSGRLAIGVGPDVMLVPLDAEGLPNPRAWQSLFRFNRDDGAIALAWATHGNLLAAGSRRGAVVILDGNSGRVLSRPTSLPTSVRDLAWLPDDVAVVVADDQKIQLCDAATGITYDEINPGWKISAVEFLTSGTASGEVWFVAGGGTAEQNFYGPRVASESRLLALPLGPAARGAGE